MQQYGRELYLPSQDDNSPAPPPPPAHLTYSMQNRQQPPLYDSQSNPPVSRNPFNDSNIALSQVPSRNSAASISPEGGYSDHGAANAGFAQAPLASSPPRQRDGNTWAATPNRGSSYSGYSNAESPVATDSLARHPALHGAPYAANSPYGNLNYANAQPFHDFQQSMPMQDFQGQYSDGPYKRLSSAWDPRIDQGDFNPDEIADDGDDGLNRGVPARRKSLLGFGRSKSNVAAGAAAGAATGGVADAFRNVSGSNPSGNYGPVPATEINPAQEKREELAQEAASRKKKRLILIVLGVLALIGVIAAAVAGGIVAARKNSGGSSSIPAGSAPSSDLTLDSPQIQALMNDKNLHRVFMGMDYTPLGAQYPDCLTFPPSQDNITMDMAVLSQLTKTIRLYGTDCNQTDMILEGLDRLKITDMKLWLAVWLDKNQTTNDRGMNAMWDILERKGEDPFEGVIVGNEVLYRDVMTEDQLVTTIKGVRSNFTSKKISLPIAVSDLGDNFNAELVQDVDVVMSNVHPFFGGVEASNAAEWTWTFWGTHDVPLTAGTNKRNIISETGWPSEGGNDCFPANCTSDTQGAVASIDGMNRFMDDFVCQSLANQTEYFW